MVNKRLRRGAAHNGLDVAEAIRQGEAQHSAAAALQGDLLEVRIAQHLQREGLTPWHVYAIQLPGSCPENVLQVAACTAKGGLRRL